MNAQKRFFSAFIVILSIFVIAIGAYYARHAYIDMRNEDGIVVNKQEPYPIRKNATEVQKEVHTSLKEALEAGNKELVAQYVAEGFLVDYFTWTNKERINDIGGLQFVHKPLQSWVYDKSLDTFYNDFGYYLNKKNHKNTLEVSEINSKVKKTQIYLDSENREGYVVDAHWQYKDSSVLDISDFQNSAQVLVLEDDDGYFSIVEVSINE